MSEKCLFFVLLLITAVSLTGIFSARNKTQNYFSAVPIKANFADFTDGADVILAPYYSHFDDFSLLSAGITSTQAPPFVAPNSYVILPGGSVYFYGIRFAPSENVAIFQNGKFLDMVQADSRGDLNMRDYFVGYTAGTQTYTFTGSETVAPFGVSVKIEKVKPWVTLNNYYQPSGSFIVASGHFFGAYEPVNIRFSGVLLGSTFADGKGNFELKLRVPSGAPGTKLISVNGLITQTLARTNFSQS